LLTIGWQISSDLLRLSDRNEKEYEWHRVSPRTMDHFVIADVRQYLWTGLAARGPQYAKLQGWPSLQPLRQMLDSSGKTFWQPKEKGILRLLCSHGVWNKDRLHAAG